MKNWDAIIVGAGLSGALLANDWLTRFPRRRFLLLDQNSLSGEARTWCFHSSDLEPRLRRTLDRSLSRSWNGYDVRFPGYERMFSGGYHALRSESFFEAIAQRLEDRLRWNVPVRSLHAKKVELADGQWLSADCVVDARGGRPGREAALGYQKFLGLDLVLETPHELDRPLLMDATVPQQDGYRFVYLLPWDANTLLVEATCYSTIPELDKAAYRREIAAYVQARGWKIKAVLREESSALAIPLTRDYAAEAAVPGVPAIGVRAGAFHPTTGYSLPDTVRLVDAVASIPLDSRAWVEALAGFRRQRERQWWFFRALNRMLFRAAEAEQRRGIFEMFYTLPEPLVARFYAANLQFTDYLRILGRRPPISTRRALPCFFGRFAAEAHG